MQIKQNGYVNNYCDECGNRAFQTEEEAKLAETNVKRNHRNAVNVRVEYRACSSGRWVVTSDKGVMNNHTKRHKKRFWSRLLNNPELLTHQARLTVGADLSKPATREEVEKLMKVHRNNPQRRRMAKIKTRQGSNEGILCVPGSQAKDAEQVGHSRTNQL